MRLPPEYHPLRSYPAIVVLHSGDGPNKAIDQWAAEAARRGYILIAPEYTEPGQPRGLPLHDQRACRRRAGAARRPQAVCDRQRPGLRRRSARRAATWPGIMPLAHPDLFAGVVVISGLPAKYVPRYLSHHERLPLFFVIGEHGPRGQQFIYEKYIKPLILKTWDITYVEYYRRGLEELPEEIVPAFDWMDRHRRDPYPKSFKVYTARTSDDRFYGIVVREFGPGRTTAPEAAEVLGQNLNPASIEMKSSSLSNLIRLEVERDQAPRHLAQPQAHRLQAEGSRFGSTDRPYFKGQLKLECEPMLEDLRVRGDRQQIYWYRDDRLREREPDPRFRDLGFPDFPRFP